MGADKDRYTVISRLISHKRHKRHKKLEEHLREYMERMEKNYKMMLGV
jgi:hypothetical protein